jgi:hypothetical protein
MSAAFRTVSIGEHPRTAMLDHQGKANSLLFSSSEVEPKSSAVHCRDRLDGLFKFCFGAG